MHSWAYYSGSAGLVTISMMIMLMMIFLLWFGHEVITTVSRYCSRRMRGAGLAMMSGVIQNTIQQNRTDTCRKTYV